MVGALMKACRADSETKWGSASDPPGQIGHTRGVAVKTNPFRRLSCFAAFLLVGLFTGCASYPMGLTRAEWEALPLEKQAELRAEQSRIDAREREQREAEARRAEAERQAAERERQVRVAEARAKTRYRDIVVVSLSGGALQYGDRRYPLQPMAFDLVKGERREIELVGFLEDGKGGVRATEQWWVTFADDGNSVTLNDGPFGSPLVLVNNGNWEAGSSRKLVSLAPDGNDDEVNLKGMTATVRFKPAPGMPEQLILERR